MAVFYLLLLVPIMLQHISVRGESINYENKNRHALTFFFIWLTVLVMLRHESVGNDTKNYIYYFKLFSEMSWSQIGYYSQEIGFSYFNKIVSLFTETPQIYLAITAIASSVMMYPTYKRLCVDASLTIVLFCTMSTFVMMFSGIRQMLAIGIGFLAYECTRNKKLVPFILAVLLAISMHTSAFMLVFMYPLYHAKITRKWLLAVVPVLAVVFMFNKQIFTAFGLILAQYTKYDTSITQTGAYTILFLFVVFTIFAFVIPDEASLDVETIGLRNFLLFSLAIQMFAPLHALAMRMNYYYIIFIPLLLPKIIKYRSVRWGQVAIWGRHIMVLFFLSYFFYKAYSGTAGLHVFPYHFFWESV